MKNTQAVFLQFALCILISAVPAHAASIKLFDTLPAQSTIASISHHAVRPKRARLLRLRLDRARLDSAQPEDVTLNLFPDQNVVARRTALKRLSGKGFIWQGRTTDQNGEVTLVVRDGVMAGTLFIQGKTFEIHFAGNDIHEVQELDPASFPSDDPPLITPAVPFASGEPTAALDASTQIDVMVLWTPAARLAVGGVTAMQNLIDLAVANTNSAYVNSLINTQLRLVYSEEVAHTAGDIQTDLSRLRLTGDGVIDQVHTLRNQFGADLVALIGSGYAAQGFCGVGYIMTTPSVNFANLGFAIVDYSCAAGNLTFAHELGHNQGLHHDPANATGPGAYPYAYGYQDPGQVFRTIMAYGTFPRIAHFSNPNVLRNGRVTGVADAQDNARALNNTAGIVANFRQAVIISGSACDLNGDDFTNVIDVQHCANQAIGSSTCAAGDINQDGQCNVVDVQRVVNAALGGSCVTQ